MKVNTDKKFIRYRKKIFFAQWRFYAVYSSIILVFIALIINLFFLQIIEPERLIEEGDKRSVRHQEISMPRGMITDRAGRILAVSIQMQDIWADPKLVNEHGGVVPKDSRWKALGKSLGLSVPTLMNKLNHNPGRFVYLARQVSNEVSDYIRKLKLPGIGFDKTAKRFYPAGASLAPLIGFTDIDGNGAEGVERTFDSQLKGEPGKRVIRRDRFGRVIEDISQKAGEGGEDIALSIDERLQNLAYKELNEAVKFNKADSGTAVVIDIKSGEILAMATSPSYNPNNREHLSASLFRNKAVTDSFEPGSTVKPFVIMAALKNKIADTSTIIDTRPYRINHFEIKDVSPQRQLTLEGILQKSSNVGASRLALQMDPHTLVDMYLRFGLGKPTHLGLGGEVSGNINAHRSRWRDIERATYAYGYGLMVTPLQLARAYATIGNYGMYQEVSLLRDDASKVRQRVMDEATTKTVIDMMKTITEVGGGIQAAVPGYQVAIKTGTAKKVGPAGKYINEYIAYTAGIAPASAPKYSLVVIIDNPKAGKYYGGAVSAPVFGKIMGSILRTMNVEPDKFVLRHNK